MIGKRQRGIRPVKRTRFKLPDLEIHLEDRCVAYVESLGGEMPKISVPNKPGYPDRTLLLPVPFAIHTPRRVRRQALVEFKRKGEKPTPVQVAWHNRLQRYGYEVWVIDEYGQFVNAVAALIK